MVRKATTPALKEAARERARLSMLRRLELAKQGKQVAGQPVWGRNYDQATGKWSVDKEKQALIRKIADRYLGGETIEALATEYGFVNDTLRYTLFRRCGPELRIEFDSKNFDIHETVVIKIPPLLSEVTIRRIHEEKQARLTKKPKQPLQRKPDKSFALTGYIFCAHCGARLNGHGQRNLRHYYHRRSKKQKPCKPKAAQHWITRDWVEEPVFNELLGSLPSADNVPPNIVRAITENRIDCLEWEDRRYLLAAVLGKNRPHREKRGVFIRWTEHGRLGWGYEIRGLPSEAPKER